MKYLFIVLAISLLFVVGCVTESSKEQAAKDDSNTQNTNEETTPSVTSGIMKTSISKLMTSGKSLKCTFEDKIDNDNTLSETIYVSGKKYRIDILMSAIEGYEFHMISDGKWLYTWNSMTNKGTKLNIDELKDVKIKGSGQTTDVEKELEFDCMPWTVSSSMFNLPSGIEFTDETAEMKEAVESFDPEEVKRQTCAMCDQAPSEELREQCRTNAECP